MIIYNVTVLVDHSIHDSWLDWMQTKHIKEVLATGKFTQARLVRVLVDDTTDGITYSVQYTAPSRELLQEYYLEHAPALRQEGLSLFADKMLAFRTELELVEEFN